MNTRAFVSLLLSFFSCSSLSLEALNITWDYSYDTTGFFTSEIRGRIDQITSSLSYIHYSRGAIDPIPPNLLGWSFIDPSTDEETEVAAKPLAENEILIYLGAQTLPEKTPGPCG